MITHTVSLILFYRLLTDTAPHHRLNNELDISHTTKNIKRIKAYPYIMQQHVIYRQVKASNVRHGNVVINQIDVVLSVLLMRCWRVCVHIKRTRVCF